MLSPLVLFLQCPPEPGWLGHLSSSVASTWWSVGMPDRSVGICLTDGPASPDMDYSLPIMFSDKENNIYTCTFCNMMHALCSLHAL